MNARPVREACIDLDAISANVTALRSAIGTDHTMAVVKANGYGHGAIPAARAAVRGGADWLGVFDIPEALQLRAAGIREPILTWMHGPEADFRAAVAAGIDVGVSSFAQLDALAELSGPKATPMQIKVDTGLSRNGAVPADWERLFEAARQYERRGRLRVRGIFSHLANAGEQADAAQIAEFERALTVAAAAGLDPEITHLAASAGALSRPRSRFNLVRLGVTIYGLSPFDDGSVAVPGLRLRPALELSAAVVSVKRVPAGSGVSYGHIYHTASDSTLALVPLGYADGVPRQASNLGPVWINGKTYHVAGRVAMDQIIVDIGADTARVGDRAVLFGDPANGMPSADDWAQCVGTINYEIIARLGGRIERTYRGEA